MRDFNLYETERAIQRRSESLALVIIDGVFGVMLWALGALVIRVEGKVKGK